MPLNDFKVGFTYSNFWDFYYQLMNVSDGAYKPINTGYFPFNFAIAKFFADINSWKGGHIDISNRILRWYLIYIIVFISPIYLFYKKHCDTQVLNFDNKLGLITLITISYPVLFLFERGNFVVVSFFFFSLFVYFYNEKKYNIAAIFISIFMGLKIMNFVLILFLINRMRKHLIKIIGTAIFINLISLYYLFKFNFDKWLMFKLSFLAPLQGLLPEIFTESFIVTDGGRMQGMSSIDNFRLMLKILINNQVQNATTSIPLIDAILMISGLITVIIFYIKFHKITSWYNELIIILLVITLFHSGSADYNLILFIPLLFILNWYRDDIDDENIIKTLSLILTITITVPIFLIEINPTTFNTVSIKSFILPYTMLTSMVLVFIKNNKLKKIS